MSYFLLVLVPCPLQFLLCLLRVSRFHKVEIRSWVMNRSMRHPPVLLLQKASTSIPWQVTAIWYGMQRAAQLSGQNSRKEIDSRYCTVILVDIANPQTRYLFSPLHKPKWSGWRVVFVHIEDFRENGKLPKQRKWWMWLVLNPESSLVQTLKSGANIWEKHQIWKGSNFSKGASFLMVKGCIEHWWTPRWKQ